MAGKRTLKWPEEISEQEDARITADAETDADNPPLSDDELARMRPLDAYPDLARIIRQGRPPLPEEEKKQRVTLYLDRDVVERLKADGKGWQTRANAKLRKALGL